jgi:hypothetical protein
MKQGHRAFTAEGRLAESSQVNANVILTHDVFHFASDEAKQLGNSPGICS